jgi:hypothetical protein
MTERGSVSVGRWGEGTMDRDDNVTLQALARRLDALERENAELQHKVASLQGPRGARRLREPATDPEERVSRRRLLSRAGAAAGGLVIATALTQRNMPEAKAAGPTVFETDTADRAGVEGSNLNASGYGAWGNAPRIGVYGTSGGANGVGVKGVGDTGVLGETARGSAFGVRGINTNDSSGVGVFGQAKDGQGVWGVLYPGGGGDSAGVYGSNPKGVGVLGKGSFGVQGKASDEDTAAVWGLHEGLGRGVVGECSQGTGVEGSGPNGVVGYSFSDGYAAVVGRNFGVGYGVSGECAQGYGGTFRGGKAQLKLVPATTRGKPTTGSHVKGEIFMDSAGALFVCAKGGTPGTWRKVSTTAI